MTHVSIIKHRHVGYRTWDIVIYATSRRIRRWNATICKVGGGPNTYMYGDPFGARTQEGTLKKALAEVKRCDAIHERSNAVARAMVDRPIGDW